MKRITGFFSGVALEMRKTSWPTKKELVSYTTIVLTTIVIMATFFTLVDLGISEVLRLLTK